MFQWGVSTDQMEGGEKYNESSMERNPRACMSMRDYRNLAWQNQQTVERKLNEYRSMSEYRNQRMSSPYGCSYNHSWGNHTNTSWEPIPPQYSALEPPYYAPTYQQQQPPPLSPIEQALLNLRKQVDNFIKDNRAVDVQANREIETVESSLNKDMDVSQSEIDQEFDILQQSISHLEEESLEGECLAEIVLDDEAQLQPQEKLMQEPVEAPEELPREEAGVGRGMEEGEETQKPILQPTPLELNPTATAKATHSPLPVAPSIDLVYPLPIVLPVHIQPSSTTQSTPKAPKAKSSPPLPAMQNIRKLVALVQTFATTSKTLAAAYIAWHSGWFGCRFGFGAPEPRHF